MAFREKFRDFAGRLADRKMYSVIVGLIVIMAFVFSYQAKVSADYKTRLDMQYTRAFDDLAEYVSTIETSLLKCAAVSDAKSVVRLANSIYAKSAAASTCLGQLPLSDTNLENTAKFLSQVGDFTHMLALRYMENGTITPQERENMLTLSRYAVSLEGGLYDMQQRIYSGTAKFGTPSQNFGDAFATDMESLESQFQDYPALIYDGPFSDHVQDKESAFLKDAPEVTREEAQAKLIPLLSPALQNTLTFDGETGGHLPTYMFSVYPDGEKDRIISYQISKKGGMLLEILDNRSVDAQNIEIEEAKRRAVAYLDPIGLSSMQDSYFEIRENIATINFAYKEGDILYYPDLVKVRIAMDNGEVLGLEAGGYAANHTVRNFPAPRISSQEAQKRISPLLSVEGVQLSVIPLETQGEALCWEFKCKMEEHTFLVYLDAETGKEQDILMLLETEGGMLTI